MSDTGVPGHANVVMLDPEFGTQVINQSDLSNQEIAEKGMIAGSDQRLLAALTQWTQTSQGVTRRRAGSLFERDRYVTPIGHVDQMRLAYQAVEDDDVVSSIADSTESLVFNAMDFHAEDEDEEDVYNQIAGDLDLDSRLREIWRELFTVSQVVVAVWWQNKTYKVRGRTDQGVQRKKVFALQVPKAITLIDPLKVIPVGDTMFNQEQLVYCADRIEDEAFIANENSLLKGRYTPTEYDRQYVSTLGMDFSADRLWLLDPENVFRHTLTRPQFQRLPALRMRSIFELLDMKQQLREMDRAHLIGGANFIVLVTKGSDQHPAQAAEIANLQMQVRTVARVPVLVGDHRLNVQIVTPKLDSTLDPKRYNLIDARITARLYQMFVLGGTAGSGASSDDSVKLMKVISRGMESRRHMIRRTLEKNIFNKMFDRNESLTTRPKLRFHPKSIDLGFDANFASFLLDLRSSNDLSRDTILNQFDFNQAEEAENLLRERDKYDPIFQTINPNNQGIPQGAPRNQPPPPPPEQPPPPDTQPPDPAAIRLAKRQGGRQGGVAPGSGQGQPPRRPRHVAAEREENDDGE